MPCPKKLVCMCIGSLGLKCYNRSAMVNLIASCLNATYVLRSRISSLLALPCRRLVRGIAIIE